MSTTPHQPEPSASDQLLLDALNLVPMCYRKEKQEGRCLELIAAHVAAEKAKDLLFSQRQLPIVMQQLQAERTANAELRERLTSAEMTMDMLASYQEFETPAHIVIDAMRGTALDAVIKLREPMKALTAPLPAPAGEKE